MNLLECELYLRNLLGRKKKINVFVDIELRNANTDDYV